MVREVAKFEKVSFEQFITDMKEADYYYKQVGGQSLFGDAESDAEIVAKVQEMYDNIKLPTRATDGSAGYDIRSPFDFVLNDKIKSILIPTGLRCKMDKDFFLSIVPKSGLGFKYGLALANTIGVVDSDYYRAENEGHIMDKLTYESVLCNGKALEVQAGMGISQGILLTYGITIDDYKTEKQTRTGGFGSTGK